MSGVIKFETLEARIMREIGGFLAVVPRDTPKATEPAPMPETVDISQTPLGRRLAFDVVDGGKAR